MSGRGISIIIPVLNEARGIVRLLERLQDFRRTGAEIIVVDGGSVDDTQRLASGLADRIMSADRGRGRQMNAGAAMARGDAFLFLHADTCLPAAALTLVGDAVANGATWGRFDVRIDGSLRGLGLVALMMNWRSRLTGIATGDQAIFVTREAFRRIGGFPDIALMEDIVLSRELRALAWPACFRRQGDDVRKALGAEWPAAHDPDDVAAAPAFPFRRQPGRSRPRVWPCFR